MNVSLAILGLVTACGSSDTTRDVAVPETDAALDAAPDAEPVVDSELETETEPDVIVVPREGTCTDLLDDDEDGLTDCDDGDCRVDDRAAPRAECQPGDMPLGAPCVGAYDCEGIHPLCHDEAQTGYPSGACSRWCEPGSEQCGPDAHCLGALPGRGFCVPRCDLEAPCRAEYDCVDHGGAGVCVPGCVSAAHCSIGNTCTTATGLCSTTELCDQPGDEDSDGKVNCEDEGCAAVAACDPGPACGLMLPALPPGLSLGADPAVIHGDTTTSGAMFAGSCTGGYRGHEIIYDVVPGETGETGVLAVDLIAPGDMGVYLRSQCIDPTSELACTDEAFSGEHDTIDLATRGGVPLALFVDAIGADDAGPFTLTLRWLVDVCGDGATTGLEGCDDGPRQDGDGCSATCQPELDVWCAAAETLGATPASGDTSTSQSDYFGGTCTLPDAPEDIYRFTAPSDGHATLLLTNTGTTRLAVYVRSTCVDSRSEVACGPASQVAHEEPLRFPVSAGESYWVFVDGMLTASDVGVYSLTLEHEQ